MENYLKKLERYVFDNDKIVTYKWLSSDLNIHVNKAKEVLKVFWEKYNNKKEIECTIMIIGVLNDDSLRVEVVREKNVLDIKQKFKTIISEHLYSIQKSLPDIQLLAISGEGNIALSAIKCNESIERSESELLKMRWGNLYNEKNKPVTTEKSNQKLENSDKSKNENITTSPPNSSEIKSKKNNDKKGFNNLFSKAMNKQTSPPINNKKINPSNNNIKKETSNLNAFVTKSSATENSTSHEIKINDKGSETKNEVTQNKAKQTDNLNKIEGTQNTKRGKKRNEKKPLNGKKKRRRVIEQSSDSESENEKSSDNDEEQKAPSSPECAPPPRNKSPSPVKVKYESGRRRVLKTKDEIIEEDGFFVTRKIHVYESCSDEEPETKIENNKSQQQQKPQPIQSKSKVKAKSNTKQPTLMNFFKKT